MVLVSAKVSTRSVKQIGQDLHDVQDVGVLLHGIRQRL